MRDRAITNDAKPRGMDFIPAIGYLRYEARNGIREMHFPQGMNSDPRVLQEVKDGCFGLAMYNILCGFGAYTTFALTVAGLPSLS